MLNPNALINTSRARELELTRAAEHARVTQLDRRRSRRARQRASEPDRQNSSKETHAPAGGLVSCDLR
jgi:hypothetical protein